MFAETWIATNGTVFATATPLGMFALEFALLISVCFMTYAVVRALIDVGKWIVNLFKDNKHKLPALRKKPQEAAA